MELDDRSESFRKLLVDVKNKVAVCEFRQDRVLPCKYAQPAPDQSYDSLFAWCSLCNTKIHEGEFVGIFIHHSARFVFLPKPWARRTCHAVCIRKKWPERPRVGDMAVETGSKTRKTVFAFLVLGELGLLGDLAWPIAAAAYWLL